MRQKLKISGTKLPALSETLQKSFGKANRNQVYKKSLSVDLSRQE